MDQFPYSLFVLEHIFLCPLFISVFLGSVIVYQHGKVLKRSLMQRWNISFLRVLLIQCWCLPIPLVYSSLASKKIGSTWKRDIHLHTVQEAQKSQEKYPGVLLYIFEIHYMRASKRRITLNCNRTRSRDSYLHNLGPNIKVCQIALWLIPYYPRVAYSIPVKLYPCN